jgi:hypothetical protein
MVFLAGAFFRVGDPARAHIAAKMTGAVLVLRGSIYREEVDVHLHMP